VSSLEEIIAAASLREETVRVCVAGDLAAEHDRLAAQLGALDGGWEPTRMGDVDPRRALAEAIRDLERRMAQHEHDFRFRALPHRRFRALRAEHTSDGGTLDVDAFLPALIIACCVDPPIPDLAAWNALDDRLTQGQFDVLSGAAWAVNTGAADVPKSARASALTADSGPR
jgi:hypothetical protein